MRAAIGASRGRILRQTLTESLCLAANRRDAGRHRTYLIANAGRATMLGTIVGIGGSLLAARAIESMLFGVRANDPLSLAAAAFVLGVVALTAAWLPARRAAAVDPMTALRAE